LVHFFFGEEINYLFHTFNLKGKSMEIFNELNNEHIKFIKEQKVFFVATAVSDGRINLSPKGLDSLKILDKNRIVWLNLTGSGNETSTHIQQNPRMTIMMNAFEGKPLILRIYGTAKVIHHLDNEWTELINLFSYSEGSRQIFDLSISSVQTSCGWAVPEYRFIRERNILDKSNKVAGEKGIKKYWKKANTLSIDGIKTNIIEKNIGKSFLSSISSNKKEKTKN
tara:strand:+ start:875 stop:1546 length:672 start_codon:yes stop_codon:yes gene_type:complete